MLDQNETFFNCPYCGSNISVLLDLSVDAQSYTEDCEICCRPFVLRYTATDGELSMFNVRADDGLF